MIDPLLTTDCRMTQFIRQHSKANPLDGDVRQNGNGQTVIDKHQQALGQLYAKRSFYEYRRGYE